MGWGSKLDKVAFGTKDLIGVVVGFLGEEVNILIPLIVTKIRGLRCEGK